MGSRARKRLTGLLIAHALVALSAASAFAQATATLSGVVRDSVGTVIRDAEVIVRDGNRATRTNDRGEFTLADVAPGNYTVWFRRLGYRSIEYNWPARAGEKTNVNVALHPIARQLDPVVVRAEEDKRAATSGSILGLVVDTDGNPIPEAEVQLVGANMSALTRANGGVLFKPLATGTYVVRVRKLGYEPNMVTLQLVDRDDREMVIRMHPLAQNLDPTVVNEKSGYGRDQRAFDELDRRTRWVTFRSKLIGPEDLKGYYGLPLDYAMIRAGMYNLRPQKDNRPMHIDASGTSQRPDLTIPGDACILLNGKTPVMQPLRTYSTDDVELLEIWPPDTELTGTISDYFVGSKCGAISLREHPTYYVLWLKNRSS